MASFGPSDAYTDKEKQRLVEFRKRVSDILTNEDFQEDSYLIRWLRARNLDLAKAEDMLRKHMVWRKEHGIDSILDSNEPGLPDEVKDNAPLAYCGVTDEGYGVFLCPFGRHDMRFALDKYGLEKVERFNMVNMEQFGRLLKEEGKKHGKNVTQIIELMDCEGYSYRQMASKTAREFMINMQKTMDANYPELLRYAMIFNAPKIFSVLFAMLKPFMPKQTLDKIDVYGPDQEKWKAVVREKFPTDRIPPYWGGTLEGVDEFCSGHEIWIQGPKDMKAFMNGLSQADANFQKVVVNARDKFSKEVEVPEKGTILEWKFKTEDHDIGFQLTVVSANGKLQNGIANGKNGHSSNKEAVDAVPYARVDSQISVQEGSHVCEIPGKYTFVFDNSFSMMKAKTLLYQIVVVDKEHQEHPENFEDCPEI